jgi:3,4-dihydroxy 2-butanone 4-phosphate synthase/GTP cyclohydrolase II
MPLDSVATGIAALRRGGCVVVVDDESRENEGDLIIAAEHATPDAIAFFLAHTSGIICVAMEGARLDDLQLEPMVPRNTDLRQTAFTASVDYRPTTTTGISAADRSATIRALIDSQTSAGDLSRPGHVFPLRYRPGGVLRRAGHTEASVDLAKAAGLFPAGVLCEITSATKREMARLPELREFANLHGLPLISIADIVEYRTSQEASIRRIEEASARIPTKYGDFTSVVYESKNDAAQHLVFVKGDVANCQNVLVRVHSECLTGDVFGSMRCDCGSQLESAMSAIANEGCGVIIYLRGHEGRGVGLGHKMQAYRLQDQGRDTVDANLELGLPVDGRRYDVAAEIIAELEVRSVRLLTNNPAKMTGVQGIGSAVVERLPLPPLYNDENLKYLWTKRERMGHIIDGLPDMPVLSEVRRVG